MKRILYSALALLAPAIALAYPVEVLFTSQGLDITIQDIQQDNSTVLHLTNHEVVAVRCEIEFDAGVETRRRSAIIEAGSGETMTHTPRREVVRMRVRVECKPLEDEGE
jgi:hypothetical protein